MKLIIRAILRIEKLLLKFLTSVGVISFSVICIDMLVQIFMRRIFNRPFVWAEDLAVFIFIWITFIGATLLVGDKSLIKVDSLVNIFSRKIQIIIDGIVDIIVFSTSLYLFKLSIDFLGKQRMLGHKLGGALLIPIWIVTLSMVFSFGIICFLKICAILKKVIELKNSTEKKDEVLH